MQPNTQPTARSAVTNGSRLLPGVDGRSAWARRFRDVFELYLSDLGGAENVSQAKQSIARRAAAHEIELENLEVKFALAGEAGPEDLDRYSRASGNQRRLLESIGLERQARAVNGAGLPPLLGGSK